jgi:hypothetical protein
MVAENRGVLYHDQMGVVLLSREIIVGMLSDLTLFICRPNRKLVIQMIV